MNLDNFDIDEFIGVIIDGFEDYLERKGVVADMLPDEDRHEIDGEISDCIFGGKLYDDVAAIIRKVVEDIDLDIINARDALARQAPRIMYVDRIYNALFERVLLKIEDDKFYFADDVICFLHADDIIWYNEDKKAIYMYIVDTFYVWEVFT